MQLFSQATYSLPPTFILAVCHKGINFCSTGEYWIATIIN